VELKQFENTSALDMSLADEVSDRLRQSIQKQGQGSLVLSGGRTPMGFFHQLSQQVLDWSKVTVTLADERWVNADHKDSNEKLVKENLLINEAHCAKFLSLKNSAETAVSGEAELEAELSKYGQALNSGRSCIAVTPTEAPHERISMTLPRLLNTERLIVHISGQNKQKVLDQANAGNNVEELPIRAILQQTQVPATVFWAI
jgi:6-phosphogluconolactonase